MNLTLSVGRFDPPLVVLLSELGTPIRVTAERIPEDSKVGDVLDVTFERGEGGQWHVAKASKAVERSDLRR
ncbi:hypothetical protein ACYOEI_02535 [Singulisphaera rosea]